MKNSWIYAFADFRADSRQKDSFKFVENWNLYA